MALPRESSWSDEQLRNARAIINVGRQVGASPRDILIGLMTAFQESGMRNLNYGDRDSLGLFQQRAGWAPRSARLDPIASARMFFTGGLKPGTPGLLDNGRRNSMSLTQAAQWVQRSAFPNAYAKHQGRASDLLKFLGFSPTAPRTITPQPPAVAGLDPMRPGELDTMPGFNPMTGERLQPFAGIDSPESVEGTPEGALSPSPPGIEAGNRMPGLTPAMEFEESFTSPDQGSSFNSFLPAPSSSSSSSSYRGPRGDYRLPGVQPWVLDAANEVGGKFGIKSIGGVGKRPNKSDHPGGLALDFMAGGAKGDQLASYVQANAKRLGITYLIYKQRIWSVGRAGEGWRLMNDRGSPTANHMDHVHVSFAGR